MGETPPFGPRIFRRIPAFPASLPWTPLLLAALLLMACGGGGDGESGQSGPSFSAEGSLNAPLELQVAEIHSGQVDTTQSYYVVQNGGNLGFILSGMMDDLDLYVFGSDATFTTFTQRPFFGRTTEEASFCTAYSGPVYVMVDGSYSAAGSAFTLEVFSFIGCFAEVLPPIGIDEGSSGSPVGVPVNEAIYGQVGSGTSYYQSAVTPGQRYVIAITDNISADNADTDLYVYGGDSVFGTPVCSSTSAGIIEEQCTYTATGNSLFFSVVNADGAGSNVYWLTVLSAEGISAAPIPLFAEKRNFGNVNDQMSYYAVGVTPGATYDVTLKGGLLTAGLNVYNADAAFTSAECSVTTSGFTPAICTVSADGSILYIAITDGATGRGGLFDFVVAVQ